MATNRDTLRKMLGDPKRDEDGNDVDPFLSDSDLDDLIATTTEEGGPNLNAAAFIGWSQKMAAYAEGVSVSADGSSISLSDRFDHAKEMVAMYGALTGADHQIISVRTQVTPVGLEGDELIDA